MDFGHGLPVGVGGWGLGFWFGFSFPQPPELRRAYPWIIRLICWGDRPSSNHEKIVCLVCSDIPRYGSCGWLFSIDSTSIKHSYTSTASRGISISNQYCFVEADIRHQRSCWQTSYCQKRRDYLSWHLLMLTIRLITKQQRIIQNWGGGETEPIKVLAPFKLSI